MLPTTHLDPAQPTYWLGAVSFEPRCTGSLEELRDVGVEVVDGLLLDYRTLISPKAEGEQSRATNRRLLKTLLSTNTEPRPLHPHRYGEFVGELYRVMSEVRRRGIRQFVIDITCLTKIHTLAVAYWLTATEPWTNGERVILAYSSPDHYGATDRNIWGRGRWARTLITCLDLDSTADFFGSATVAILGHEGDRLRLALHEADATDGLIIKVTPDMLPAPMGIVTDAQNAWLAIEIRRGLRRGFQQMALGSGDLAACVRGVGEFAAQASLHKTRIILCPFGPKPFVLAAALAALMVARERIWVSYPVPVSYNADYSSGCRGTEWFDPERLLSHLILASR